MDFSHTLIRCSSLSKIMAEPKESRLITDKQLELIAELEAKELAGKKPLTDKQLEVLTTLRKKRDFPPEPDLGDTAKSELIDIYLWEKFGLRTLNKDKMIMYTEKGKLVEEDSIKMLSAQDGTIYIKNGERIANEFITGEPDIWIGEEIKKAQKIIDIKSSWDAETFIKNLGRPLKPAYYWQMQGYMALTGATVAEVCFCLVDTPQTLINDEKRRLYYSMGVSSDEDPIYQLLASSIEHNMIFSGIDPKLRVMRFIVDRNDQDIEKVYQRVSLCRKWLNKLDNSHENMYLSVSKDVTTVSE